jgi:hypothetical protein
MLPDEPGNGPFIALGTWVASPGQIAGSELEYTVSISPTGCVLVLDVASDKDLQMARISQLIDQKREAAGIAPATRRGPPTRAERKLAAAQRLWPKLLDDVRQKQGLRPGPPYPPLTWRPGPPNSEYQGFLKSIQDHHIVPLWDLQLAGLATDKLACAQVLYRELANPARGISQRSIPRVLLNKIDRAGELQDQVERWISRLRAVVG